MQFIIAGGIAIVLAAVFAFIFWRRMGGRTVPDVLRPGQSLPRFHAVDEQGKRVDSAELVGRPSVILFVRGTWCPFCSRQVADLTRYYKEINDLGARLILITPKPLETTRRVAKFFDVDFEFWLDESLDVASKLGLLLPRGVPSGYEGEYGDDTLWPTSLVVDSQGTIRYTALSKFVADRPDPEKLLNVLNSL